MKLPSASTNHGVFLCRSSITTESIEQFPVSGWKRGLSLCSKAHGLVFSATCLRPASEKRGSAFSLKSSELRFPPYPSREKNYALPPVTAEKTSFPSHTVTCNANNNMLSLLSTIKYSIFPCTRAPNVIHIIRLFC